MLQSCYLNYYNFLPILFGKLYILGTTKEGSHEDLNLILKEKGCINSGLDFGKVLDLLKNF